MVMARGLAMVSAFCLLSFVSMPPADAQTQFRNFNLNCGLIGKFVRYPQHLQHCKALAQCSDPRACPRKRGIRRIPQLALTVPEELADETATRPPGTGTPGDVGDPSADPGQAGSPDSLGARAGAEVSARAGGASIGAGGGASIGSGSNDSAGTGVGGNVDGGGALGGVGGGAGGSLGVGGL
jgi:hypothetical protein